MKFPDLDMAAFDYELPEERIAQYPLPERDASRLLVCGDKGISDDVFSSAGNYLPARSLLVFNDTRVIHARLRFRKPTGSFIEIFCLEPLPQGTDIQAAFSQKVSSRWKCLVGNLKRWKSGPLHLEAVHGNRPLKLAVAYETPLEEGTHAIRFTWEDPALSFAEVIENAGTIPLPPYIGRDAEPGDRERYQTVYAANDGSVAAPTAGLHFTGPLLDSLSERGMEFARVTLHVGAGTFKPVTASAVSDHVMHVERIQVSAAVIGQLLCNTDRPVVAVGTTSARTLESLYWLGVHLVRMPGSHPSVGQWDPYHHPDDKEISREEALGALLSYLQHSGADGFSGETRLMIVPGYRFRILSGLVTNFHMPRSTLLLLVAALAGERWREAYEYALEHGFRFLSYGDACLFFEKKG